MAHRLHPNPSDVAPSDLDRPGPEEAVFRETFLTQLTRRDEHATVRAFGDLLAGFVRDFEGSEAEVGESWYFRELRAGAADLRSLEGYFRAFHLQRYGNSMAAEEHDLCDLGRQIAGEIARLAGRIEDAVGEAPGR